MRKVSGVRFARSAKVSVGTKAAAVAVAVLLLSSLQASTSAAREPAKLSQVFVPGMLETKVASFEEIAGKAWKVLPGSQTAVERRIYKIEKCDVEAAIGYETVRSLRMKLSDRCTFELTAFFAAGQRLPTVGKLTFGEAERALGTGPIVGVCLFPCGKAYRPAVYEHLEGSKADNFIDAILEVGLIDDVAIRAASEWSKLARQDGGKESLKGARFNCDGRYDELGHRLFDKIRITAIRIGYNFTEPWQCD